VGSRAIVKNKIPLEYRRQFPDVLALLERNFLVLHRAPKPFHHAVVHGPALAVHADVHPRLLEHAGESLAGELGPLR